LVSQPSGASPEQSAMVTKRKRKPAPKVTIPEDVRRERGQALLAVRVPGELVARLDSECERRGMLRPALVRAALEEWLAGAK
jgi:ribbon-helix-helix CopG family protein